MVKAVSNHFLYIYICLGAGVGAVLTAWRAGGWFASPGSSDASRAPRWAGEGSSSLPNSRGCSCFPRCCSVGNYTVNGLVGGCGHPSWVPCLRMLADPQVRVKLGADKLGLASWEGERPTSRCPGRAGFSVLQSWRVVLGHWAVLQNQGCSIRIPAACPSPVCPFPARSGCGVLWGGRSHGWLCRGGGLQLARG